MSSRGRGRPRSVRSTRNSRAICARCNQPIHYRDTKRDGNAIHGRDGLWLHRHCYDSSTQEAQKTCLLNFPLHSNENSCIFIECAHNEVTNISQAVRDRCATMKLAFIKKGSMACANHMLALKSLEFEIIQLTRFSDTFKLTPEENTRLISSIHEAKTTKSKETIEFPNLSEERFVTLLGTNKFEFRILRDQLNWIVQDTACRNPDFTLAIYLFKMKTGLSDEVIGALIGRIRQTISYHVTRARKILNDQFVPPNLGLGHISRQEIMTEHTTEMSKIIHGTNKCVLVMDGTYVYCQKSNNFTFQRETFSGHKKKNLLKMFMIVTTDGYIVDVTGPFDANVSDATLLGDLFIRNENEFVRRFPPGETILLVDRGFRNIIVEAEQLGYEIQMPPFLSENAKQLTNKEANDMRMETKFRWIVEVVNGQIKFQFRIFNRTAFNCTLPTTYADFRICCSLLNYLKDGQWASDRNNPAIAQRMLSRRDKPNLLSTLVANEKLTARHATFRSMSQNPRDTDFPVLTITALEEFCCGTYQIKMAKCYVAEHMKPDGRFEFGIAKEDKRLDYAKAGINLPVESISLYKVQLKSRHSRAIKYNIFVLIDKTKEGIDSISEYYCTCKVGTRTVGCCSHTAALVWYLTFGCYHESDFQAPGARLSSLLEEVLILPDNLDELNLDERLGLIDNQIAVQFDQDVFEDDLPEDLLPVASDEDDSEEDESGEEEGEFDEEEGEFDGEFQNSIVVNNEVFPIDDDSVIYHYFEMPVDLETLEFLEGNAPEGEENPENLDMDIDPDEPGVFQ